MLCPVLNWGGAVRRKWLDNLLVLLVFAGWFGDKLCEDVDLYSILGRNENGRVRTTHPFVVPRPYTHSNLIGRQHWDFTDETEVGSYEALSGASTCGATKRKNLLMRSSHQHGDTEGTWLMLSQTGRNQASCSCQDVNQEWMRETTFG